MKKRFIIVIAIISMLAVTAFGACGNNGGGEEPATDGASEQPADTAPADTTEPADSGDTGTAPASDKDKIVIGGVRSSSGTNAIFEQTAFGPQYKMWVDELNQDGGLYVKELDKKLPIELKIYDDKSDPNTTVRLYEQLCLDEKVDLLLPPVSTAMLFAVAPIAQKYGYLLIAGEGGAKELEKYLDQNPNVFSVLGYSTTQVPAMVNLFKEQGVKSVYCVYIEDLHGTEYWGASKPALEEIGVEIKGEMSVPLAGGFDANAVITAAKESGAEAFLAYCYPDQGIPIAQAAIALDYNPNVYLMGPGGSYDFIKDALAGGSGIDRDKMVEGIIGWGGWNEKSSPEAKEYSEHFRKYWTDKGEFWLNDDGSSNPDGTVFQDWWGHASYYSVCQIYQQAVENAGALNADGILDNAKLVEYVKNNDFDTVLNSSLHFTNNILTDEMYLGNIGQWQKGIFEVLDTDDRRTAEPIIPKPAWPKE
jgi:branched-chain amino acid transport system substrate-binding protein